VYSIFLNSANLRELRLNGNTNLTDAAFPDLGELTDYTADEATRAVDHSPWFACTAFPKRLQSESDSFSAPPMTLLRPVSDTMEHLRQVDLTGCSEIGDIAIENLVTNASRLRSLTLAKCSSLTDVAIESVAKLGKHLHYLHLGHVSS
jgi:F-box and leucine-rich repeat protein GRR1